MSQPVRLAVLLAFAAVPLLEIGLLIRLGQSIGFWRLALLVVLTAVLGTIVIRRVGLSIFKGALQSIETGRDGLEPLLDGFLQVTAGMLLIFPGVLSDAIGVLLLMPAVRRHIISSGLLRTFGPAAVDPDHFRMRNSTTNEPWPGGTEPEGVTIEGEYERLSEETVHPRPGSVPRRQPAKRR
jgi:UPF0716 protein FxsA